MYPIGSIVPELTDFVHRKDRFRVRSDDGASSDVCGDRGRLVGGEVLTLP